MKIPLPGRSAAFSAPTGNNAADIPGQRKTLKPAEKMVLSLQASHLLQQAQLVHGITFTSNGLWGHNPARQGFDTPDTPPERRDEHEEKNP